MQPQHESRMSFEIILTPTGHLRTRHGGEASQADLASDRSLRRIAEAFEASESQGLFALAADKPDAFLGPALTYWREFACRYLTRLCRTPESAGKTFDPIEPPNEAELASMLLAAPPITGAEYLGVGVFLRLWHDLDHYMREELASSGLGLGDWLGQHAPLWRQVGRVCFHLAENKRDPDFPFAFLATYAPRLSHGGRVQYQPLRQALQEYAGAKNKAALIHLLSPVQLASQSSTFVKELVDSGDLFHPLAWTPREAYQFLKDVGLLEASGVLVRIPDWWRQRARPRVAVTIGQKKQSRFGVDAMLDFQVQLALGEERLTEAQWQQLLKAEDGLIYLRGQWVEIDRQKLAEALDHWKQVERQAADGGITFAEGMRLLAGAPADLDGREVAADREHEWALVTAGSWLRDTLAGLRDPQALGHARLSKDFRGQLRPYQQLGHDWLAFVAALGLGACLADDMGLGKTVQVLALLLSLKEQAPSARKASLLVVPASLLGNWKSEMQRFTPALRPCFVHPSESGKDQLAKLARQPARALAGVDLVVTTYAMLLRQPWLLKQDWRLAILDEAQAIKNPSSRQSRAVKQLRADARMALTGTPVENRLGDLWSLFDFLCPGLLGSANRFKQFVRALDSRQHDRYAPLRNLVAPYILRRLKTDKTVIADLPDKSEVKAFCGLSKRQTALYAKLVNELAQALETLSGIERRGLVLAYLMRFKQLCNHPSHLLGDGDYAPAASGKFERLRAICEEIASRQEKVLVFTQFREMTEPLAGFLAQVFEQGGLVLHGGTTVGKRKGLVDAFQRDDGPPFFVLSLKAGGTGLNLTAASHVIHFDRWWNPAVENQATDRAFRIGQHRNVMVHKFICRGTVEEKIDALIAEKVELAEGLVGAGETILTELPDDELLKIVALDIDKATT